MTNYIQTEFIKELELLSQRVPFLKTRPTKQTPSPSSPGSINKWTHTSGIYHTIVDETTDIIFVRDLHGKPILVNSAFTKHFGLTNEEILQMKADELFPKELVHKIEMQDREIIETDKSHTGEEILTLNGTSKIFVTTKSPYRNKQGKAIGIISVARDITEVKQTEEELLKIKEHFTKIQHKAHMGIWEWNSQNNVTICSDEVYHILGFPPQQDIITYKKFLGCVQYSDRKRIKDSFSCTLKEGKPSSLIVRTIRPDNSSLTIHLTAEAVIENDNTFVGLTGIIQDLTPYSHIEKDTNIQHIIPADHAAEQTKLLQQFEGKFETFVKDYQGMAFQSDMNFNIHFIHGPVEDITGYTEDDLVTGKLKWNQIIHPNDKPKFYRSAKLIQNVPDYSSEIEYRIIRKDGKVRWIYETAQNICDSLKKPFVVLGTQQDVTRQKRTEKRLNESKEQIQSILDNATAVIYLKDTKGRYILVNRQFENLFNISKDEIIGKTDKEIFPNVIAEAFRENDLKVLKANTPLKIEEVVPLNDMQHKYISIKFPLYDSEGKPYGVCGFSTDITKRDVAESKIAQNLKLLNSISNAQSQFIEDRQPFEVFNTLLTNLLEITNSEYGFIGEVLYEKDGTPYLKIHSITNIAWNEVAKKSYTENARNDFEFFNVQTIFEALITGGKTVIFNYLLTEKPQNGFSEKRLPLNSFMGLPFFEEDRLIGMAGIANRPGGYHNDLVEFLLPFVITCANLIMAYKNELERKEMEMDLRISEERFRSLIQSIGSVIICLSADYRITEFNLEAEKLFGYTRQEILGMNFLRVFLPEEEREMVARDINTVLDTEKTKIFENEVITRNASKRFLLWSITRQLDALGNVKGIVATGQDITERKSMEQKKKESDERFRLLVESSHEGIIAYDKNFQYTLWNKAMEKITGIQGADVLGKNALETLLFLREMDDGEAFKNALQGKPTIHSVMAYNIPETGKSGFFESSHLPLYDGKDTIVGGMGIIRDATERKIAEEKMNYLAYYDMLTSLPNRALFNDRLEHEIAHAQRYKRMLAVVFIDLDRFKSINDTLGHSVGDQLLKVIAERLKRCLREGDTISRQGGDEFTMILTEVSKVDDVKDAIKRILSEIRRPVIIGGHELYVSTSVGIACYPNDGLTGEILIKNADTAMYRSKESGRDNFHFYSPVMNEKAYEQLLDETKLRRALEGEEFLLYYQPQVDILSGKVVGLEALLRWQHSDKGLITPSDFIPLAEDTGLIVSIDLLVLRSACAQNKIWRDSGIPIVRIAVNISSRTFQQANLIKIVENILNDTGLSPNMLELEITEGIAIQNIDSTIEKLNELNRLGVQIALDDFGTGFSSLNYLSKFPIHKLKVDGIFLDSFQRDSTNAEIITAIIAMTKALKLKALAEHVETDDQLEFLKNLCCDEIQGHIFCKAKSAKEIGELLHKLSTAN